MENSIDYVELGHRIRESRQKLKMTQFSLAEQSNLTPTNISHIERGANKVSLPALLSIANALHVSMDFLLRDSLDAPDEQLLAAEPPLLWEVKDCSPEELALLTEPFISMKKAIRQVKKE